jgi:transposase
VIGTTIGPNAWQDTAVITVYKRQSQVEGGCRFLEEPRCGVSSLLVKTPDRLQWLLMVMTLAFLVYAVAQRRWRQPVTPHQETGPHHSNHPTTSPT